MQPPEKELQGPPAAARRCRWLPRVQFSLCTLVIGVLLVSSGMGLWFRWEPWEPIWVFPSHNENFPSAISADARFTAHWVREGGLVLDYLEDKHSQRLLDWSDVGNSEIKLMSFSPDRRWLVLVSDKGLIILDLKTAPTRTIKIAVVDLWPLSVAFSPDSRWLAFGHADDHIVEIRDIQTGTLKTSIHYVDPYGLSFRPKIAFSPDSDKLAIIDGCRGMIADTSNGNELVRLQDNNYSPQEGRRWSTITNIYAVSFTSDGNELCYWGCAGSQHDFTVKKTTFCVTTGRFTSQMPDNEYPGWNCSADGRFKVVSDKVWSRRRPEYWWGVAWLPEFWLTLICAGALRWSVWRDRRDLRPQKKIEKLWP